MDITEKSLRDAGFSYINLGDESPYEIWEKDNVKIWEYNGLHWIVDILDQAGVSVEFTTMEHLNELFLACRLPSLLPKSGID